MSSYSSAVVERIRNNLFATPKEMEDNRLSEFEQTRILRLRDMYNHWIAYPTTRERDITEEILRRWPRYGVALRSGPSRSVRRFGQNQ